MQEHLPGPELIEPGKVIRAQAQNRANFIQHLQRNISVVSPGKGQTATNISAVELLVQLVPFDLIGGQARNKIVDIADAGDKCSQIRLLRFIIKFATSGPSPHRLPGRHVAIAFAQKDILHLPHDHQLRIVNAIRQAQGRIDERGDVQLRAIGVIVKAGFHGHVGVFQTSHPHRRAATQERIISADV